MKRVATTVLVAALSTTLALCGCTNAQPEQPVNGNNNGSPSTPSSSEQPSDPEEEPEKADYSTGIHHAEVKLKGYDTPVVFEIYSDSAPKTALKFAELVESGYYDDKTVHTALDGIYMKFGSSKETKEHLISGEYEESGVSNSNSLREGVIALARAEDGQQSDASNVIIFLSDSSYLDGKYAGFGRISSGYSVIEDIANRVHGEGSEKSDIPTDKKGKIEKKKDQPVIKSIKMVD